MYVYHDPITSKLTISGYLLITCQYKGDELSAVSEVYVFPKFAYLLDTQNLRKSWIGVQCVVDETSTDEWAKDVGYHQATIDGQVYSYPLLSDALRAYDTSVVRRKGGST